jgi:phosphoserine phosphatase RsbU/P
MRWRAGLVKNIEWYAGHSVLVYEAILAGVAFAVGLVLWFFGGTPAFGSSLIYSFVIGNFVAVVMGSLSEFFTRTSLLQRWIQYLAVLLPVGVIGAVIASLAVYMLPTTGSIHSLPTFLIANVKIGMFVTLLASISMFTSRNTRERLEDVNRRLLDQVQLGDIQLQDQAAELRSAHEIQTHLIPSKLPQIAGLQVSAAWQPARAVGGDYFDVLPFSPTRLGVCIADVSGKGMGAALLMANCQAAFRAFATEDTAPHTLCTKLNRALCSSIAPGKFVTFFYGILDMSSLRLDYENAGHSQPILLRGNVASSLEGGGTVLGLFHDLVYDELSVSLQPGDCLLLTTDGITEAANPLRLDDEFGEARLIACAQGVRAQGAYAIRSRILEEVTRFCESQFQDDASLIVITIDEAEKLSS